MLGINDDALSVATKAEAKESVQLTGWNEQEREVLQKAIAARQPFLDFAFHLTTAEGSQRKFQVSGEPMFDWQCRFVGYRGIGVELTKK
jgi:hypothetical protein